MRIAVIKMTLPLENIKCMGYTIVRKTMEKEREYGGIKN